MNKLAANIASLVMIAATATMAIVVYPGLPEYIPTHWNAAGEVDGYMPKSWGVGVVLGIPVFLFLLMKLIPVISPKGHGVESFAAVMNVLQVVLVAFGCFVAVLVMLAATGVDVRMNKMIFGGIGILFLVIGLCLGRVKKNNFVGFRTPWTLSNEEVWERTHRLGGRLFMLAGLIMFSGAFLPLKVGWVIAAVIGLTLYPVVYSYLLHRRLTRDRVSDAATSGRPSGRAPARKNSGT